MTRRILLRAAFFCLLAGRLTGDAWAKERPLATFAVREQFGVAHPDQVIDFDLRRKVDATRCKLIGPDGNEVAYQLLADGKRLAVRTDLPAGATKTWRLVRGKPGVTHGVSVTETATHFEIANELLAVRVQTAVTNRLDVKQAPAPIQGLRLRDGAWTGLGPNYLAPQAEAWHGIQVHFLERGPLKTVVALTYKFTRPAMRANTADHQLLVPAGDATYRCTIEVQAGQPSILFEEDADLDLEWSANLFPGLEPTQARYRGHHATEAQFGREPDGQRYRQAHERPSLDAEVDLRYDRPMTASYAYGESSYRHMAVWDPWIVNSGWYWQFYNADAPATANFVGIFTGCASRALGAAASGVGLWTRPSPKQAGITVALHRLCADTRWFPRVRFQWRLFVGTKADLKPPTEIQPINAQMNLHGGINLNKVHRFALAFPDPPQGYGATYLERARVQRFLERLRADHEFFTFCSEANPQSRPLLDMWTDATGNKARLAAKEVADFSRQTLDIYVNGLGVAHPSFFYWQAGQAMLEKAHWCDALLASDSLAVSERATLQSSLALFAYLLWDDDFTPLFTGHGLNLAQGPVQYGQIRDYFAMQLARHPSFRARAEAAEWRTLDSLHTYVNEHGAGIACTHYLQPYLEPILTALLQFRLLGRDHFKTEPRLAKFAEFYLNLLTPPEPRAGGRRCFIATSDSSFESSEMYGLLATGFRAANPDRSGRLMGAWKAGGRWHDSRFGTSLLMIDDEAPAKDPQLADANFPGYYSVLRHGWGTTNETAAWFINGDFYREHRHPDQGMVVIYALGAPVSVHWGSLYTPQVPGAFHNNTVLLEDMLGCPWDKDNPPLGAGGGWSNSTQEAFASAPERAEARARFRHGNTTWTRAVMVERTDPARPVIVLRDTFAGEQAAAPKVMSLNLMAAGEVLTPAGKLTPPLRTHVAESHKDGAPGHELPSATPPFDLPAGTNRFVFTGRYGVDCEVLLISDTPQQALLGNWAVTPWGGHITDREERQHILRVRGTGNFVTILRPTAAEVRSRPRPRRRSRSGRTSLRLPRKQLPPRNEVCYELGRA
jgi:hypothetical protein